MLSRALQDANLGMQHSPAPARASLPSVPATIPKEAGLHRLLFPSRETLLLFSFKCAAGLDDHMTTEVLPCPFNASR